MNEDELSAAAAAEASTAGAETDEAADLWAEFEEMDGAAGSAPAATDEVDETAEAVDGEAETGAASEDAVDAATAGAPAEAPVASPWDSAPEHLRSEFEKLAAEKAQLEHEVRSHKGRAVGAQRRYEELLKAAQPREVAGDRPSPQAALSTLKEDYPELAGPLEKALGAIEGQIAHLSEAEEGRRTAAQNDLSEFIEHETRALTAQHPDYLDVLGKNAPKLVAWIDDQPRAVRDAFARNADNIVDAAEAAQVIGMFKAHLGMPAPAPASAPPRTAAPLDNRRQRQLGATTSLSRSQRRPTVSGIPEDGDPQQIWDAFEEAERRR